MEENKDNISTSPSNTEKMITETDRKINDSEKLMENLMKRFDNADQTSDALEEKTPDLLTGGDHSVRQRESQPPNDRPKNVTIELPIHAPEITLRFLDRDLDKDQQHAETSLTGAKRNLVSINVKNAIQGQLENSDGSQKPIVKNTNEITDDVLRMTEELRKILGECQVANTSDWKSLDFVRIVKNKIKLSLPEKKPEIRSDEETVQPSVRATTTRSTRSKVLRAILYCFVAWILLDIFAHYVEQKALNNKCALKW